MSEKRNWEKKSVKYDQHGNRLNMRRLKAPQTIWCEPEEKPEDKHQMEISKIYVQDLENAEDFVFALCPIHNNVIKIRLTGKGDGGCQ